MPFNARQFKNLLIEGFEGVRYVKGYDKLETDKFISSEMINLRDVMGMEIWEAETLRGYRGKKYHKSPISPAVLNKFVYVCLTNAKKVLNTKWADNIFLANDMGREDMHPDLLDILKKSDTPDTAPEADGNTVLSDFVPVQRPSRPAHFVGREQEIQQILKTLQPGNVNVICGAGGIGKSAVAAETIWQATAANLPPSQFSGGVIYYNFYNQPEARQALEHIARSYEIEPVPTPKSAAQRALSNRQALLILDGAEVADNLPEILSIAGDCGVLITTRRRLDAVYNCLELGTLPESEAVKLFKQWVRQPVEEDVVKKICKLLDGLPLAIELAGRYIVATREDPDEYLNWLKEALLPALHYGEHEHESIPVLLRKNLTRVGERARQSMLVIGVLAPTSFTAETVAASLGWRIRDAQSALGELVIWGILRREQGRYQAYHLLIYEYAQQYFPTTQSIVQQLAKYFIRLLQDQNQRRQKDFTRLDMERSHIITVLDKCMEQTEWEIAYWMALYADEYLDLQGHWTDRASVTEAGLTASRKLGNRQAEIYFLNSLWDTYTKMGQLEKAAHYMATVAQLTDEFQDSQRYIAQLIDFGNYYYKTGEPFQAMELYQQALLLAQRRKNEILIASCLGNIGLVYQKLDQPQKAIDYLSQGLEFTRQLGVRPLEEMCLGGLGVVFLDLGDPEQAAAYHQQALEIAISLGDRRAECIDLLNLGIVHVRLQKFDTAIAYLQQSLDIAQKTNDSINRTRGLIQLASIFEAIGQPEKAKDYLSEVLPLVENISPRDAAEIKRQIELLSPERE